MVSLRVIGKNRLCSYCQGVAEENDKRGKVMTSNKRPDENDH